MLNLYQLSKEAVDFTSYVLNLNQLLKEAVNFTSYVLNLNQLFKEVPEEKPKRTYRVILQDLAFKSGFPCPVHRLLGYLDKGDNLGASYLPLRPITRRALLRNARSLIHRWC